MPAPKGNQNARKEAGVQPLYLKVTCGPVTITRVVPTGGGEYQIWGK